MKILYILQSMSRHEILNLWFSNFVGAYWFFMWINIVYRFNRQKLWACTNILLVIDYQTNNRFPGNFVPKTKKTVYYIVGAILINDAGQILMIQEAKYSCYGQWYLPMGRVEREESFLVCTKNSNLWYISIIALLTAPDLNLWDFINIFFAKGWLCMTLFSIRRLSREKWRKKQAWPLNLQHFCV